jgi:hypothetical protein
MHRLDQTRTGGGDDQAPASNSPGSARPSR